jgi:hypothetical protein
MKMNYRPMKKLPKLARSEEGYALVLALILTLVGSLIVTPLLGFMSTGLIVSQVHEKKTMELYAADAGAEDAIWKIQTFDPGLPEEGDDPWEYSIADVNGKQVNSAVEFIEEYTYKITSTATSDSGGSTTVESYIGIQDFTFLLDKAITSMSDVTIQPGTMVEGDVHYNGELDNKGNITGEIMTDELEDWPTAEQLAEFYWEDVKDLEPYSSNTVDLKNLSEPKTIGPLYRDGDLYIRNTGSQTTAALGGTVYVTGDLVFEQPGGPKAYTIDLNGQTIFVEGSITFPAQRCSISGSGCIIAVGDVTFQPGISASEDDFVFVMSLEGEVWFNPQGDFYGSVAGTTHVDLQPNCSLRWSQYPDGLNFLGQDDTKLYWEIRTWEIS